MSDSEAPDSLGILRLGIGYEQLRKPAAKVVFLGDTSVGKSSIIAFVQNGYTANRVKQDTTIVIKPVGEISLTVEDGGSVRVDMWDTAGQEQFRALTPNYLRGAHGAVLVYDVTCKETFTNLFEAYNSSDGKAVIPSWLDQFLDIFKESNSSVTDAHIAVLGNKVDMSGKVRAEEAKETIAREMKKRGVVDHVFYETSALTGQNLDEFAKTFASKFERFCTPSPLDPRVVFQAPERAPEPPSQTKRSWCC